MRAKREDSKLGWLAAALALLLLAGALGACTLPKGGGTDGPPT